MGGVENLTHMQPLNAIIVRFTNDASHQAIEKVMDKIPMNFCASIGDKQCHYSKIDKASQPWFCSSDVRGCQYDDVDWNSLAPIDEELVQAMYECESMFMHMVSRTEKSRIISYRERKRMYLRHLRFWNDFIDRHNINIFISAWIPHEVPDHIIHFLCRLRGIPTLMFIPSPILNYEALFWDWEESDKQLGIRYQQLLQEYEGKSIDDIPLSKEFDAYYMAQKQPKGKAAYTLLADPSPLQVFARGIPKDPRGSFRSFSHYVKSLISPRAWFRRVQKFMGSRRAKMLHRFFCKHASKPDFSKSFIYAPLQLQPECSTCPMGGGFMDQELVIQLVANCIDDDVLIYIKEHPLQMKWSHACRSIDFYQDLLDIPNVRFMTSEVSSFDLREHCIAIATGTGTAGFEACFREKPVLMFGHNLNQYAPGVFSITTVEDCRNAMKAIMSGENKPTLQEARLFLKAMEETMVRTALAEHHQRVCDLSQDEIIENTANALVAQLTSGILRN